MIGHSLRTIRHGYRFAAITAAAASASGSGFIYCFNSGNDPENTVPGTMRCHLSWSFPFPHDEIMATASSGLLLLSAYGNVCPISGIERVNFVSPVDSSHSSESGDGLKKSIVTAAAMVAPAVVIINIPWSDGKSSGASSGSGTIIDADGTVLTCAHLLLDAHGRRNTSAGKVDVTLPDGRTFVGSIVNADAHSDIGIVKINSNSPLPVAKLGSSRKLRPGDPVVTIGCPLSLHNTVTAGIVSCLDRKSSDIGLGGMPREYIQTDCATNKGNSGGPLVNLDGEVVGVHIMSIHTASGYSFAVPIDSVTKIIEHFKKHGKVVRPWLGLKMIDLSEMIVAQLREKDDMFPNVKGGALVAVVIPRSPADVAGFCPGDVITEINGQDVRNSSEIASLLEDTIGQPATVTVRRTKDCSVLLNVVAEEAIPDL
ncbi:unnamed protein product [Rhodiola kirilowii]